MALPLSKKVQPEPGALVPVPEREISEGAGCPLGKGRNAAVVHDSSRHALIMTHSEPSGLRPVVRMSCGLTDEPSNTHCGECGLGPAIRPDVRFAVCDLVTSNARSATPPSLNGKGRSGPVAAWWAIALVLSADGADESKADDARQQRNVLPASH